MLPSPINTAKPASQAKGRTPFLVFGLVEALIQSFVPSSLFGVLSVRLLEAPITAMAAALGITSGTCCNKIRNSLTRRSASRPRLVASLRTCAIAKASSGHCWRSPASKAAICSGRMQSFAAKSSKFRFLAKRAPRKRDPKAARLPDWVGSSGACKQSLKSSQTLTQNRKLSTKLNK